MGIVHRLFGRKTPQINTIKQDKGREESAKINVPLSIQVDKAEKCIHLNLQLVNFLATCGRIHKEQIGAMRDILNQSGLPVFYTQNMLSITDTLERSLDTLSPEKLDDWRVNTTNDLSKETSIYSEFINKIDPQRASKIREVVQTRLIKIS
ncbi:MAG: hypothetical protein K4571_20260 [Deltaproteobacteria bacterium]